MSVDKLTNNMKEVDIEKLPRKKTYEWFNKFSNPTYGIDVMIDVSEIVKRAKEKKESFFILMLYVVTKGLNSVPEMRMRFVNDKPVIFEDINPAITVIREDETFENVRFENKNNLAEFYKIAHEKIEEAKYKKELDSDYNIENCYNEYYITCLPWINFTSLSHPIPDDKSSLTVPRVCFGKYSLNNGKYEMMLNITVSHAFVDGIHMAKAFKEIQELANKIWEFE